MLCRSSGCVTIYTCSWTAFSYVLLHMYVLNIIQAKHSMKLLLQWDHAWQARNWALGPLAVPGRKVHDVCMVVASYSSTRYTCLMGTDVRCRSTPKL